MLRSWTALALLLVTNAVTARVMAPPPMALRVAASDGVFVGTVTSIGDKLVAAELAPGDDRMMQIAEVTVSESLLGSGSNKVKVGFFAPAGRRPGLTLTPKDVALFTLVKHPTKKEVYVAEMYYSVLRKADDEDFKKQIELAKSAVKMIANPLEGLKSKEVDVRFNTAALLITRYRTQRPGAKEQSVPLAESKLILEALAAADWSGRSSSPHLSPLALFGQLGLTEKDGWTPPGDFNQFGPLASKWLKTNAATFKLKRWSTVSTDSPEP